VEAQFAKGAAKSMLETWEYVQKYANYVKRDMKEVTAAFFEKWKEGMLDFHETSFRELDEIFENKLKQIDYHVNVGNRDMNFIPEEEKEEEKENEWMYVQNPNEALPTSVSNPAISPYTFPTLPLGAGTPALGK